MTPNALPDLLTPRTDVVRSLQARIGRTIDELLAAFPSPERLTPAQRRGIVARYSAVLEGNFIYWMTATYLAVISPDAQAIIAENLREEIRDNHPGMLRRFAAAAHAMPNDRDALDMSRTIQSVRAFVGGLSGIKLLAMMAFFEGWINRFMPYLADLGTRLGSAETEYTDVHGVVDVLHSQELLRAFAAEVACTEGALPEEWELFEGIDVLRALIEAVGARS